MKGRLSARFWWVLWLDSFPACWGYQVFLENVFTHNTLYVFCIFVLNGIPVSVVALKNIEDI